MENTEKAKAWVDYQESLTLENLKLQQSIKSSAMSEINKIVLLVSTGTFVLSISFIGYLKTAIAHPLLLVFAWIFLVLAIAGNVASQWLLFLVSSRKTDHLNTSRSSTFKTSWEDLINDDNDIMNWDKYWQKINVAVFFCLGFGILCLIIFGGTNLYIQFSLNQHSKAGNWDYPANR